MISIGKVEPKYILISKTIREQIREGVYPIHSHLPDGKTLATAYDVSLMTLKRALDLLVAEGYIIRRRGDGTVVRDWKNKQLPHLYSLKGTYHDYGEYLTSKVIRFEVVRPSGLVADKLSLTAEDFVYEIIRLRVLDGRPIIIEYTYMPISVIPGLKECHLEKSIYTYIQEGLGRKVHSAFIKLSGVRPSLLEQGEMGLTEQDFLMEIEQVGSLDNCKVFEYSISRHLPDVFDFETVMFN